VVGACLDKATASLQVLVSDLATTTSFGRATAVAAPLGVDAGKREFMFPYHQYPSTSAASTPGMLSFPYGGPGGAYQESGGPQKQKKKGKKHRHANTSSSGGGVVDVADPSILQMRASAMAGQGGYGGQGQGGFSSLHSYSNRW